MDGPGTIETGSYREGDGIITTTEESHDSTKQERKSSDDGDESKMRVVLDFN